MDQSAHVPNPDQSAESAHHLAELRLRRIEELQTEALAKPNASEASLGAAKAALLRMSYRVEQVIEEAFKTFPNLLEKFDRTRPMLETHLKIMRQYDRLEELDQRTTSERQAGKPEKPR